jgi:AbrB family looped-hinge helix DNA binding protein
MPDHYSASIISNLRSYRITIPKEIVRANGLRKGDRLAVTSEGSKIILEPEKRQERGPTAYSIGYEGKTLEEFLNYLSTNKVKQLIDVRKNAFSFKAGFSKSPLKDALSRIGMMYIHIPQLGTDQESRKEYKETGDIGKLFDLFSKRLEENLDSYEILMALLNHKRSAMMCFEDDYTKCHRSIIENRLKGDSISVVHLCNGRQREFL